MEDKKSNQSVHQKKNGIKLGQYRIGRMEKGDWPEVLHAVDSEKEAGVREWYNYSLADADVEFRLGQDWVNGFFVLADQQSHQILGHVQAVKYGSRHAYIGGYYVHNSIHGTDVALSLLQSAIDYLKGRNIMADFRCADLAIPRYENEVLSQFKEAPWRPIRYVGLPMWDRLPSTTNQPLYVCHARMIRVEDIAEFDRSITGQDRSEWLRYFLRHSNDGWIPRSAQLIVTDRRGDIRGYGCVRPGKYRARIGPIFARDFKVFLLLFRNLMGSLREARECGVDVVVSSTNRQAIDVMESVLGLERLQVDGEIQEAKRFCSEWHPHVALEQAYCLSNCSTQFI